MCYAAKFFVRENEPLAEHLTKWLSKEEREALVRDWGGLGPWRLLHRVAPGTCFNPCLACCMLQLRLDTPHVLP
jgi:hypothetical protein